MTIGTRGSPLALAQTREVRRRFLAAHALAEEAVDIQVIRTTGDAIQDRPLSEAGGKGLFTKELDTALLEGGIDLAVHSSKDLPTHLPPGIAIAGFLPREDVRDALIARDAKVFADLPEGAVLGTASLRRQAQALRLRPDLKVVLLRGNVETRLRKVADGEIDATLLALAGLKRLGLADKAAAILPTHEFLPAVGQGAIAITVRDDDHALRVQLAKVLDPATHYALAAERAFLAVLDGSCRTPIAGHATVSEEGLRFAGMVLRPDGSEIFEAEDAGPLADAAMVGDRAGRAILARLPAGILA